MGLRIIDSKISEVLLDAPRLFNEHIFSEDEKKTVLAKGLNHYQAFSPVYKYYLLMRYGVLLKTLEKMINERNASNYLEIGCGTGNTCIYLAKNTSVNITGVDLNDDRLSVAKKRMNYYGFSDFTFYHQNFLEFDTKSCFDFTYSLAAFEAINPKNNSVRKLLDLCASRCTVVLDMINPSYVRYNRRYFTEDQLLYMMKSFQNEGFTTRVEYLSVLTPMDITGISKRMKYLQNSVRLIAVRN